MLRIKRTLPGELDGTLNPANYGYDVLQHGISKDAAVLRAAQFYRRARARTEEDVPQLNRRLTQQPYDHTPAQELLERYKPLAFPLACEFGRAQLEIDEGVFSPIHTSASPFLLDAVDFKPGERMLDAFAGSGAFGINAALWGATVVGFDISPKAVACARKNAALNGVAEQVDVRNGSLNECVMPGEVFDLIVANPPLIPLEPQDGLETALFDPGLQATRQFIAALPALLAKKGRCYLLTSDVIDRRGYACDIAGLCAQANVRMMTVAQLHKKYESYRIHKIEHKRLKIALRRWVDVKNPATYHSDNG